MSERAMGACLGWRGWGGVERRGEGGVERVGKEERRGWRGEGGVERVLSVSCSSKAVGRFLR